MSDKSDRREFLNLAGLTAAAGLMATAHPAAAANPAAAAAPAVAKTMGAKFRELLQKREPFETIAAYDVMTARIVEQIGFPALYMGGSLTGDYFGEAVWLTTMSERCAFVDHISQRVGLPGMADVDDGGDAMSVYRVTKAMEHAGAGAILILDSNVGPMGRASGVIPVSKMIDKIHAAVDARSDMVVTARCNAAGPEGKDRAIERAVEYARAGCETIWFGGMTFDDLPRVADAIKIPVTAQMQSATPMSTAKASKVTCAIYASLLQNIAQSAVYDAVMELKTTGLMVKAAPPGTPLGNRMPAAFDAKLLQVPEIADRGKKFNVG